MQKSAFIAKVLTVRVGGILTAKIFKLNLGKPYSILSDEVGNSASGQGSRSGSGSQGLARCMCRLPAQPPGEVPLTKPARKPLCFGALWLAMITGNSPSLPSSPVLRWSI